MKFTAALVLAVLPSTISAFGTFQKSNIFRNFGIAAPPTAPPEEIDLYTEIDELLDSALLMYPIAYLRGFAKKGELPKEFLELPMSAIRLEELINKNMDMVSEKLDSTESELQMDALRTIVARQETKKGSNSNAVCREFQDDESNKELVYSVRTGTYFSFKISAIPHNNKYHGTAVLRLHAALIFLRCIYLFCWLCDKDPARNRVIVAFRGSITKKDLLTDAMIWMKDMPNRMKKFDPENQPDIVRVHAGFWYYLFGKSSLTEEEYNELLQLKPESIELIEGEEISKFDEILQFHVLPLLKKNPGYSLSVTGHSLGAALATMFAFRAATIENESIIKPVTCVSVASPYVGDENYRQAFMLAEKMGRIRHLRLSNHKDVIGILPFVSFRPRFWKNNPSVGTLFKHVGLNLKLYENKNPPYELTYPNDGLLGELSRAWGQSFFTNLALPSTYRANHGPLEYNDRLQKGEEALKEETLESMFETFMNRD